MVRFAVTMLFYVLFLVLAVWGFVHLHPSGLPAYVLAVLPARPILAMLVVIGLYLAEEKDEFVRNMQIQALLGGIGGTLAVVSVWGFLENFTHVRRLDLFLVFPLFWIFVGISTVLVKLRYR
jgi:4-amino-4-deoxy-L-arabinose transferase-like glycosyltransferase